MNGSKPVSAIAALFLFILSSLAQAQVAPAQWISPANWFNSATAAVRKPETSMRIDLIGDSTQTPNAGYGRGFCANLSAKVDCLDMAKGGASTKTYRAQGLWQRALETKPDYMLIQFGHNDEVTPQHLAREVPLPDYAANLKRFVAEARAAGITPVLVTPLTRRYFGTDAVLISAGRTRVIEDQPPEPPNATIEQHILRPEARISFSAVQAISQVVGFLQTHHKQFRIHEADSNNLQDLRQRPVVLVSGYNNIWTLRLLRPLRFHFEQAGALHYIVDAQHPDSREWSVDFNQPYRQETADYAIIGRFYDATSGGPVVVVAGIGSNGSEGAGEFIVSPDELQSLAGLAPDGKLDKNFEAVLKVQVVTGDTGAASVVAAQFW